MAPTAGIGRSSRFGSPNAFGLPPRPGMEHAEITRMSALAMLAFYVVVLCTFMLGLFLGSLANWYPPQCVGPRICTDGGKLIAVIGSPGIVLVLAPIAMWVIRRSRWALSAIAVMSLALPLLTLVWAGGLLAWLGM